MEVSEPQGGAQPPALLCTQTPLTFRNVLKKSFATRPSGFLFYFSHLAYEGHFSEEFLETN
jgi:hypothetical protein